MPTRPLICRLATLSTFCAACVLTQLCPTLWTLWTIAHQAPVSIEFSRQEYWNGLPFPTPGDLPDPGIKLVSVESPLAGRFFTAVPPWKPVYLLDGCCLIFLALS